MRKKIPSSSIDELLYGCNYCDKGFPSFDEYSEHWQQNHRPAELPERPTAAQIEELKSKGIYAELRGNAWE